MQISFKNTVLPLFALVLTDCISFLICILIVIYVILISNNIIINLALPSVLFELYINVIEKCECKLQ